MTPIEKANKVLAIKSASTSQIDEAIEALKGRTGEVMTRLRAITSKDTYGLGASRRPGPVRRQTLESGTPEQLAELDDEQRLLEGEKAQLEHADKRLKEARRPAASREAAEGMPEQLKRLDKALQAEQKALESLREAQAQTDAQISTVRDQRRTAGNAEAAKPETLQRYMQLRGLTAEGRTFREVQQVAEALGIQHRAVA